MTENYMGFNIEWRGHNWYGFCDEGCKGPFIRKQKWAIVSAMEAHWREKHGGQLVLEIEPIPLLPNGFPF